MNLRQLAEKDLGTILENEATGFGWPITITDPDGNSGSLTGMSGDISQVIDPETGIAVSGRLATATVRLTALRAEGLGIPKGIADRNSLPWVVVFNDIEGEPYRFKVAESDPDRTLGFVNLILEFYPV